MKKILRIKTSLLLTVCTILCSHRSFTARASGEPKFRHTKLFNGSTNLIWVDALLYDGNDSGVPCGWLGPKVGAEAFMGNENLPKAFRIKWHTPNGSSSSQDLDSSAIKSALITSRLKDPEIVFAFTPEQKFVLKAYFQKGDDMHFEGSLIPDESDPRFATYKELVRGAIDGDAPKVRKLLEKGAPCFWPCDPISMTPLEWSVRWEHKDVFDVLFAKIPADYSPYDYAACIQFAVTSGKTNFLNPLFQNKLAQAVPASSLQEIFYGAAYGGKSTAVIDLLLKQFHVGIDYKVREVGHTMLFVAVQENNVQLARWLLDHGASPNITLDTGLSMRAAARTEEMRNMLREPIKR